jgi:NO-binding membrane sensor protein with MHYT domain
MKWGRILVAGIGTQAAVLLVITLVATGYAFKLAFEVQGAPDQTRIGQFAEYLGRSYWWVLQILLTAPAAAWAVRKVQSSHQLHGVLIGLVVAVTGFVMSFTMSFRTIAEFALTVGAGWLGGAMAAHHRMKQDRGHPTTR